MAKAFNQAELMDRIDGDIEFLQESIDMLEEDSSPLLHQIRNAVRENDADSLVGPAHTLKGMLSNFCADAAEAVARDLEMRGREKRMEGVDVVVVLLDQEVKRLRIDLRSFLGAYKD